MMKPTQPTQKVPVTRRSLVAGDETRASLSVFCPAQEATVPVEQCVECGFVKTMPPLPPRAGEEVECAPPLPAGTAAARVSPRMDLTEAAARVALGELIGRQTLCVRPETSMETLVRLMTTEGYAFLPVVDADWALVGTVSATDVLCDERREAVADVMRPPLYALPEDTRLAHAMSLMAYEGVTEVPVVTREGAFVGVVTSVDCMRWLARQMGYAVA